MIDIDAIDLRILALLQKDGSLSQRALAEKVGLSQNACWRRMQRLRKSGAIQGYGARLDAKAVGLHLTVFVMIRTRNHSREWADTMRAHIARIPEVVEMHRIGGDWDYMLKVVTDSMSGYDAVYQRLIDGIELETVTGYFAMETVLQNRPLAIEAVRARQARGG